MKKRIPKPPVFDRLTVQARNILGNALSLMKDSPYNRIKSDPFAATHIEANGLYIKFAGCPFPWAQRMPIVQHLNLLNQFGLVRQTQPGRFIVTPDGYKVGLYVSHLLEVKYTPWEFEPYTYKMAHILAVCSASLYNSGDKDPRLLELMRRSMEAANGSSQDGIDDLYKNLPIHTKRKIIELSVQEARQAFEEGRADPDEYRALGHRLVRMMA